MKAIVQRVKKAHVTVNNTIISSIETGLVVLLGVAHEDKEKDAEYLVDKIINLRIFEDDQGKMNRSLLDVKGELLVVSQFTIMADCRKGRRPSFTDAAPPEPACRLYRFFADRAASLGVAVKKGKFQANMDVSLINQGPVTLILESPQKLKTPIFKDKNTMDHLTIILVRPQGPINIGAICRVMMNFGCNRLRLVSPCSEYKSLDAKKMALSAFHLLEQAQIFETLEQALFDVHSAYGTTRRFGKYRKGFLTPATAGARLEAQKQEHHSALVLGPEDTGLETKDLELCQYFITIPTHDGYPSMNLSHSLAVLLYEASLKSGAAKNFHAPGVKDPARGEDLESMFAHMKKTLLDIDYLDPQNPDHLLRTYRRIFSNAGLSSRDVRIVRGLLSRIDWTESQRRLNQPTKPDNKD